MMDWREIEVNKMRFKGIAQAAAILIVIAGVSPARADTLPLVKMVNGTPIAPTTADAYYASATAHTAGLCALNSALCNLPRPPAIVELARTLSRGGALSQAQFTQNVFEYVYRNIDTEFRYGLSKGGFGALLDQSGTPFDQAHLMVELLRQGGVSASYQVGTITLTPAQFQAWAGLANAQAACQYLANGGIPAIVNGSSSACSGLSGNVTSIGMAHIWVSANATLYDPSFKAYIQKPGIDLAAAIGCGNASAPTCGSQAVAAAIPGSSQGHDASANADYVQNVQYAALGAKLNSFATNLQHYIQQSASTASVQDIVGGQQIDPASAPSVGGLPYTVNTTAHSWTGDVPDQYRSRINIQFNGINQWLFADETYGYWLHVGGSSQDNFASLSATLFFEMERNGFAPPSGLYVNPSTAANASMTPVQTNEVFALASATGTNASKYIRTATITVDHPYASSGGAYMDDTLNKNLFIADSVYLSGSASLGYMTPILVVQSWGRTGRGSVDRAGSMASAKYPSIAVGSCGGRFLSTSVDTPSVLYPLAYPILTKTTLPQTAATWLYQAGMATTTIDGFSRTRSQEQHSFGLGAESYNQCQNIGGGLDVWSSFSVASSQGNSGSIAPSFAAETAAYNALEGSAVEQSEDAPDGKSAIRWLEMTNEQSNRFYLATSSNIASVLSATTNYNGTILGDPKNFVSSYFNNSGQNFNAIVPKSGSVGTWVNGGTTYTYLFAPMIAYSMDGAQIAYVSTSGMKGAGFSVNPADPVGTSLVTAQDVKPKKPLTFAVDPSGGSATVTFEPDLVTGSGEFPNSLAYKRFYNSSDIAQPECQTGSNGYILVPGCVLGGRHVPSRRLSGGWRDNFEIEADFANDGARALGSDTAVDASAAITALYTIFNLAQGPSLANYLSEAFTAAWMTDQIGANAIVIRKPPKTETYVRLPDGTFNPRAGESGQIVQTGTRVRFLGTSDFLFGYGGVSLVNVDKEGARLSFLPYMAGGAGRQFKPVVWNFANGTAVNFTYSAGNNFPDIMTGVSNNLGRSLSFAADTTASSDPDGYKANAQIVTDENGRTVRIRDLSSPQYASSQYFGWIDQQASTKVMLADNSQWRINYNLKGSSISPDFTDTRVSSVAAPNNISGAYLSLVWDTLYRVKSVTDANGHGTTYFPARVSGEKFASGYEIDANGNVTQTWFDGFSHPVKLKDPLGRISAKAYDDIGRLVMEANPQLGCIAHGYDVRGNEISSSQYQTGSCALGDPGNGQVLSLAASPPPPLVTASAYLEGVGAYTCANWATCNKPSSQTDARGNVTNYTWDATTGNLKQILRSADAGGVRPQVDLVYTPLGAGASACSNGATAGGIAMICQKTEKISSSAGIVTSYAYNAANKYVLQSAIEDVGGLNLRSCFSFDAKGNLISSARPAANLASCP